MIESEAFSSWMTYTGQVVVPELWFLENVFNLIILLSLCIFVYSVVPV